MSLALQVLSYSKTRDKCGVGCSMQHFHQQCFDNKRFNLQDTDTFFMLLSAMLDLLAFANQCTERACWYVKHTQRDGQAGKLAI